MSTMLPWTKQIWNKDIHPSKAVIIWKLMLGKLSTYDQLMYIGYNIASVCSLCKSRSETLELIFFSCTYARRLWLWFCRNINDNQYPSSLEDLWKIANDRASCGGIARDNSRAFVLAFSKNIIGPSSFYAECRAVIRAI
ncbi:hypothetical protein KIW84_042270 [Lathyrus oleraceus]|uniref:Reverse transcriptase zinc-binding domain-containing protein n=1 Tax=Pisum sativum TaxID=3888 RepID=A0A9D4XAJ2_PEA|nr:hypothetical protein KIW84_042270 [Pisum sativum]